MVHIKRECFYGMIGQPEYWLWVVYPDRKAADDRISMIAWDTTIKGIQRALKRKDRDVSRSIKS